MDGPAADRDERWETYRRAVVEVALPDGTAHRLLGPHPDAWWPFDGTIHVLTAWNPAGRVQPDPVNRAANARLAERLAAAGARLFPAIGSDADPQSDYLEHGFLAAGLSRTDAVAIAVEFEQEAIYEADATTASVVPCGAGSVVTWPRVEGPEGGGRSRASPSVAAVSGLEPAPDPARLPLTILDLAIVGRDESVADALAATVALARRAEALGYHRVWYAEHHNMAAIASSATSVLIGHVADRTERIRLGAGAVMLPNHSPLTIAEQFGTLATLHPGRIDLGLGRAPGTDQRTVRSLRRDPDAAERFPQDVVELQGFLSDHSRVSQVAATPGQGTHVPLYVMGSSLFGATLAAAMGLPYAFASHFAPQALDPALAAYRERFEPSAELAQPFAMAAINVIAASTREEAEADLQATRRSRVRLLFGRGGRRFSDDEADVVLQSPQGAAVDQMMTHTAVGTPGEVRTQLDAFLARTQVDELIVVPQGPTAAARLRSVERTAEAHGLVAVSG